MTRSCCWALLPLTVTLAACARPTPPGECRLDAPALVAISTRTFWIRGIEVPLDARSPLPGLDIDGESSTGRGACPDVVRDGTSSLGDGDGIDNALASVADDIQGYWSPPGTIADEIDIAMRAGAITTAILVREDGTDSCGARAFTVRLHVVVRDDGAPIELDARRVPTPGQPLSLGPVLATGRAAIDAIGRLLVPLDGAGALAIDRAGIRAPLGALGTMDAEAIAFDLSATGISRGVLAGSWDDEELVADLVEGFGMPGTESVARSLLSSVADLPPAASDERCTRLSAGLGITAEEIPIAIE